MDPPPELIEWLKRSKFAHLPQEEALTRVYASYLEYKEFRAEELASGCQERYKGEKQAVRNTYNKLIQIHDKFSPTPWDAKSL